MDVFETAISLCSVSAPSGNEKPVMDAAKKLLEPLVDEVWTDVLGNLIGVKRCGRENAKKLLIDAHLDEIGLIITGYEDGFLRFSALGGLDSRILPASEILILSNEPVKGVIACQPPHILSSEEMEKIIKIKDMYIDIGMSDEQARKAVKLGDTGVVCSSCGLFGTDMLCCKALDDRLGFAAVLAAVERLRNTKLDYDLYIMGSTQEEVGLRGAEAGVFTVAPDYAVVVDTTFAYTPDSPKNKTMEFGGGAAIGVGPNMSRTITERFISVAGEKGIPYQFEVMEGNTGTNAWKMQISREGVATAVLSIPIKYMHSPVETVKRSDAQAVSNLIYEFAATLSLKGDMPL